MNLGLWPEAVPFDPDGGAGSGELEAYLEGVGFPPAALVVAGRGLRASEWAARAAIGVARALAAAGRDVLLADLEFGAPALDSLLSAPAAEGLADVLLFGASLERVTVMPAGQSFEFVPAGGFAPDPGALMADPGWTRLLAELAARDTVFLGYAHYDAPGLDQLVARIPSIVLLAHPADASRTVADLPETLRIEAMVRPAGPAVTVEEEPAGPADAGLEAGAGVGVAGSRDEPLAPPSEPPGAGSGDEAPAPVQPAAAALEPPDLQEPARIRLPKDEAREALIADLRARERAAIARAGVEPGDAGAAAGTAGDSAAGGTTPVAPPAAAVPAMPESVAVSRSRRWRRPAGAAVVLAGAASVWFFLLRDAGGDIAPVTAPAVVARPQAPPEPVGAPVGWSVAVEAHDRLDMALRSVESLAVADSTLDYYVSPAVVSGGLWYRVLAGPLADSVTAVAAMERLVAGGLKRAAAVWDVRATPLAFLLGRFPLESDAIGRMNELMQNGVPSYVVEVPYSRGAPWYHLYGGAYSTPPEAEPMGQLLRGAGLPDSLVVRVGRNPS